MVSRQLGLQMQGLALFRRVVVVDWAVVQAGLVIHGDAVLNGRRKGAPGGRQDSDHLLEHGAADYDGVVVRTLARMDENPGVLEALERPLPCHNHHPPHDDC